MSGYGHGQSAQQLYALAQQLHKEGRHAEAERHYRSVLSLYGEYVGALTRLGEVCFLQRKFEEAEKYYRRAVAVAPRDMAAQSGLGCTLNQLGRHGEALPHIETALKLEPRHAGLYLDLGNTLSALNRLEEAVTAYLRCASLDPAAIDARYNAGNCLARLGRTVEAITQFEAALAQRPDHVASLYDLGIALNLLGDTERSMTCFERAIQVRPDFATAYWSLVGVLQNVNQHEEALVWLDKLAAVMPESVQVYNLTGRSLSALGRNEEAKAAFDKSLALDPDHADTHFEIGNAMQFAGRFAEARLAIERAVAIAPRVPAYWYTLALGETIRDGDPALAALEEMALNAAGYSELEQAFLHFALAKVYDDLKRYDKAFECLAKANALKRRLMFYDEAKELEMLHRIAALFSAEQLAKHAECGDASEVPVFIVGMPRSGTTLVEQILASHPKVFGAGEVDYLARLFDSLRAGDRFLTADEILAIGSGYVEKLRHRAPEALRITDKMPGNFVSVGLIRLALPKARIIHVRRHPVETCFSCYSRLFNYGHLYAYDLGELGRYYRGYESLMEHWRDALPPATMLEIFYEDLIEDFEKEARRLVDYCGLEWDDACLSFHETERPVDTASVFQVRQPLYRSALHRAAPYQAWLGPLYEALGLNPP